MDRYRWIVPILYVSETRALLRLERTMNLLEGGKGGWGREGGDG